MTSGTKGESGDRLVVIGAVVFVILAPVMVWLGLRHAEERRQREDRAQAQRMIGFTLEMLRQAQLVAQVQLVCDRDADGIGEFCDLGTLKEADLVVSPELVRDGEDLFDGDYLYTAVLPENVDNAERIFAIVAAPLPREDGYEQVLPMLAMDETGRLHVAPEELRGESAVPSDPRSWPLLE